MYNRKAGLLLVLALFTLSSCGGTDEDGRGMLPVEAYSQGVEHMLSGELEEAVDNFDEAIRIDPNFEPALKNRAEAYADLENWSQAIADYGRLIELGAGSASVYNGRGLAYAALGDREKALADYAKAMEIAPDYVMSYVNRGGLYLQARQPQLAFADLSKAIDMDPSVKVQVDNLLRQAGMEGEVDQ